MTINTTALLFLWATFFLSIIEVVVDAQLINNLFLINTDTNTNLGPIRNGTIIRLNEVGSQITIRASVVRTKTSSVIFDMDGIQGVQLENTAPYTLAGDTIGLYYNPSNALIQPGVHTISATPYSKKRGAGISGPKYSIQFTTSFVNTPTLSPTTKVPTSTGVTYHCGCSTCTDDVWNQLADGYTCGARIAWVMSTLQKSEIDACIQIVNEFPTVCNACDSGVCTEPTVPVTGDVPIRVPVSTPVAIVYPDPKVWNNKNKCGGAVNTGATAFSTCTQDLWQPTQDTTQHCYAYGGPSDPCALHNNNDADHGLFKNPSACTGDTFYLWDEPDTQGKDYTWAGMEWVNYAARFTNEIMALRAKGTQFTSPLLRAGGPGVLSTNLNTFYAACGAACHDPSSPAYININAINAFAGPWNRPGIGGCLDAATFITNEIKNHMDPLRRPWYITNWSRIGTEDINAQVEAMNVIQNFFIAGSPVQRIYWFGATDYGGNSKNNFLTSQLVSQNGTTTTLGQIWQSNCNVL